MCKRVHRPGVAQQACLDMQGVLMKDILLKFCQSTAGTHRLVVV